MNAKADLTNKKIKKWVNYKVHTARRRICMTKRLSTVGFIINWQSLSISFVLNSFAFWCADSSLQSPKDMTTIPTKLLHILWRFT